MRKRVAVVGLSLGGLVLATGCKAPPCPATYGALTAEQKKGVFECACEGKAAGSVWGDGIYTSDSSLCAAAVHAGALTAGQAGKVKVQAAPGCSTYRGSAKGGVQSRGWGSHPQSFVFPGIGDGQCPPPGLGAAVAGAVSQLGTLAGQAAKGLAEAAKEAVGSAAAKIGDALGRALSGAAPPAPTRPGECPARWRDVPNHQATAETTCDCYTTNTGAVWGNRTYTADSNICRAAMHAGAIPASGGKVTVRRAPGCDQYPEFVANGVYASAWGRYDTSFYFAGHGDGSCHTFKPGDPCPARLVDVPDHGARGELSCRCAAGVPSGSVYGTGIFTSDSNICRAARHAGAVGEQGGLVTVKTAAGCPKYVGSTQQGIPSASWGSYGRSFYFAGHGDGRCP
jgi:hypothetical protein